MARKRKYIDRNLLKTLCEAQLTDMEIAVALRVDRTTLWRRYATAIKAWKSQGVSSIRRKLYATALGNDKGAVTAAIFYLKNYGGMADVVATPDEAKSMRVEFVSPSLEEMATDTKVQ